MSGESVPPGGGGAVGKAGPVPPGRARRALAAARRWYPWFYTAWLIFYCALNWTTRSPGILHWAVTTLTFAALVLYGAYLSAVRRAERAEARAARAAAQTPKVQSLVDPKGTTHIALWLSQN